MRSDLPGVSKASGHAVVDHGFIDGGFRVLVGYRRWMYWTGPTAPDHAKLQADHPFLDKRGGLGLQSWDIRAFRTSCSLSRTWTLASGASSCCHARQTQSCGPARRYRFRTRNGSITVELRHAGACEALGDRGYTASSDVVIMRPWLSCGGSRSRQSDPQCMDHSELRPFPCRR